MRVFVTGATGALGRHLVPGLVAEGHEVTVVTCAPNFPDGRVYAGYENRWRQVEIMDGIRVVRVKTYVTANEGIVKRTLDYMSFMGASLAAGLFEERPDVVVATSPQFFAAIGGYGLAALRRLPFVFEVRDLWPASIVAVGALQSHTAISLLERLELFLYRQAQLVIVVTEAFKDDITARGIPREKIHVVPNGADLRWCAPRPRDPALAGAFGLTGKFVVGYVGTHGMAHGLGHVLDCAERLRDRPDIAFFFAGSGAERAHIEAEVKSRGLDNVRMIPRQPKERVAALWSLCDLTVIPLRNDPVFATVIPSKLFEAMGNGVPVLLSLPEGEATALVQRLGCGLTVPPESPPALAASICALADAPERLRELQARALAAAPDFSREHQAQRMIELLALAAQSRILNAQGSYGAPFFSTSSSSARRRASSARSS